MKHSYSITGMTCQSCAEKIETVLSQLEEVSEVKVSLEEKTAQLTVNQHVGLEKLNEVLKPLGKYELGMVQEMNHAAELPEKSLKTYWPLALIITYILFGAIHLSWVRGTYVASSLMADFMGLFFLAFGFFKLLDLKGFAQSYRGYDLPTKAWPTWGYLYPFVEVSLGLLYLYRLWPVWTNIATILVMGVSVIGVIQTVAQKRKIKCVCLGTGFNLPMSTVTIIEDGVMILMAGWMLFRSVTL